MEESMNGNRANVAWNDWNLLLGVLAGALFAILGYAVVIAILNRSSNEDMANTTEIGSTDVSTGTQDSVKNVVFLLGVLEDAESTVSPIDVSLRLNTLSDLQLQDLLNRSIALDPSTKIRSMQELIVESLARLDPSTALKKTWSLPSAQWKEFMPIVFGEWAVLNLDEALKHANNLPTPFKEEALHAVLSSQAEVMSTSSEHVAVNSEFHRLLQQIDREAELAEMLEHPHQAWNLLVHDEVLNAAQQEQLVQIAETWVLKDGYEVLTQIFNDLHRLDSLLFDEILMALAKHEPDRVFRLVADMPFEVQRNAAATVLGLWAKQDPKEALATAGLLQHQRVRGDAQSTVIYEWAQVRPRDLLSSLTTLPAESQKRAVQLALRQLALSAPKEAALLLGELRSTTNVVENDAYYALIEGWTQSDSAGAIAWVLDNSAEGSELRARMLQRALSEHAYINPQESMHIALSQEPHSFHGSGGLEYYVIDSLASRGGVDEALTLLDQLRAPSKPLIFGVVGSRLIEAQRANEALDLAKQLPESEQGRYFAALVSTWLTVNQSELLETLESMSTKSVQAEVAKQILNLHQYLGDGLTEEQISFVQSFLEEQAASSSSKE